MVKRKIPESWAEKPSPPGWAEGGVLCITKDPLPGTVTIPFITQKLWQILINIYLHPFFS